MGPLLAEKHMKPHVEIYDTTLRDGAQAEGINFSAADKLRIAEKLDAFGVQYIEGGWPGSNPKDLEFFQQAARRKWKNAQIAAFSMTRRKGVAVENDELMRLILESQTPVVTIVGKTWLLHVTEVLRAQPEENLGMIADTIRYLKDHGKKVIYDAEHSFDGFADEPEYALATWQAAEKAGADCIVLCDTNGGRLPREITATTALARAKLNCPVGIHTHNDCGLGVANAVAAVEAGAMQVQGTINGFGERTGNCNSHQRHPHSAIEDGPGRHAQNLPAQTQGAFRIRERGGQCPPRCPRALGGPDGVCAQGRHACARHRTRGAQLRTRQPRGRRQFPPRPGERHVRPHQHSAQGPGTRLQAGARRARNPRHHRQASRNSKPAAMNTKRPKAPWPC
jgi:hypothetical protein